MATPPPDREVLDFLAKLNRLGVPILTAPRGSNTEFKRPKGWQLATPDHNHARVSAFQPGDALIGVMGGRVAVIDIDTKNGADVERTRQALDALGIPIYADVLTPSGGRHFYVAGHPELPTVHAQAGRDGLKGHPGVEVISYGANVFLPGTTRPKYADAPYVITSDNLDALLDGGDPDAGEALAAFVAERRVSPAVNLEPAPPWDGAPPDTRQAAYLEAAVRNLCDELAAMGRDTGRNVALYTSALKLGSLVAGAGLDEALVIDRLTEAASCCGLLDEDGPASVSASIGSGLRNGRRNPRPVPAAVLPVRVKAATVAAGPIRCTLHDAHAVFTKWLGASYDLAALDAMLASAAVERLDGDPVWLLVVSGSGNAKTETVQALDGIDAIVTSTISSPGALLSGTAKRDRTKDATGGLLRKIGDRGVLVVKDVTSVLSMQRDMRAETLGALREVYDGRWSRNVGTDGGRTIEWRGRIAVVGAVTTAWDKAHDVIATMGDRFVLLRVDSRKGRESSGRQAIGNIGSEDDMRTELAQAVAGVIAGMNPHPLAVNQLEVTALLKAANLVTLARTGVEFDYRGDVIDAHAPEMPTRFAKQLAQIVRGGTAIGLDRAAAMRLAIRCARDSMPPMRLLILDDVAAHPYSTTQDVRRRIDKPYATVDRQLQALHMLGVLTCEEQVDITTNKNVWKYLLAEDIDPSSITPVEDTDPSSISPAEIPVTRNVSTYPQTPKKSGNRRGIPTY